MENLNFNVEELYSGSTLQQQANQAKDVKSMKDGVAKLVTVQPYTSKGNGSLCAKLSFQDMTAPNNPNRGHDEYLSTREGARFSRVLNKLKHLAKFAKSDCLASLPSPFTNVVGENGRPIMFTTNEQMSALMNTHGQDCTFLWVKDLAKFQAPERVEAETEEAYTERVKASETEFNKTRMLVRWSDKEAYINAFCTALTTLVGNDFKLKFSDNEDNDFRSLKKILPATI